MKISITSGSRTSSISGNSIFSNAGLGIDLAGGEAAPAPGPIGFLIESVSVHEGGYRLRELSEDDA